MSEFVEGLRRGSGEAAATAASLERKGSRGFKGGIGIDAEPLVLLFGEEMEQAMAICKPQLRDPTLATAMFCSSVSLLGLG